MTEITLQLQDEVVKDYGIQFLKSFLEKQMEYLSLSRAMDKIEAQVKAAGLKYDAELESIREDAWKDYKKDFLN